MKTVFELSCQTVSTSEIMLTLNKKGKVCFQKYTRDFEVDPICLNIVSDVRGVFNRKSDGLSRVSSLQKLSSNAFAHSIKDIINETVQVMLKSIEVGGEEKEEFEDEEDDEDIEEGGIFDLFQANDTRVVKIYNLTKHGNKTVGKWKGDTIALQQFGSKKIRRFWRLIPKYLKYSVPSEILEEIEEDVLNDIVKEDKWRHPKEIRKYLLWKLFFPITRTSNHLALPEYVNCSYEKKKLLHALHVDWSGLAFYFLTNDGDDNSCNEYFKVTSEVENEMWNYKLSQVEKLTLGASSSRKCCHMRQKMINGMAYKTNEWKERLPILLKKLPNLKELILLGGFCDDEMICMIGKYCNRLKLETIRICCEVTEYPDAENLTDEGMCEFIERISGVYDLNEEQEEDLLSIQPAALVNFDLGDCYYPYITAMTLSALSQLKNLKTVNLRLMHFQWGDLVQYITPKMKRDETNGEKCTAKTMYLSVGQTKLHQSNNVHENKNKEILDRFSYVLKLFPNIEELHLREVHGDNQSPAPQIKKYDNTVNSIETVEFEKLSCIYQMASSLNLFRYKGYATKREQNHHEIKSLHLKERFFPVSTHKFSKKRTKLIYRMSLVETVETLHLEDFPPAELMEIKMLKTFNSLTKIFMSYGSGYTHSTTFPLYTVLKRIFESVKSLEDLQMIGLNTYRVQRGNDLPLIHDEQLRSLILDPDNSKIRRNLRVFVLSTGCNGKDVIRDSKLGLSIENSAAFLQKNCENIKQIGCLKSWKWKSTIKSAVSLNNFLLLLYEHKYYLTLHNFRTGYCQFKSGQSRHPCQHKVAIQKYYHVA